MSYIESMFSLDNKISIVTGAAGGNGKSISEALLRSGSTVIMVDISKKDLSKIVKKFQNKDLPAIEYYCDITNKKQILELSKHIKKKFGRLDILVNNAGISLPYPALDYSEQLWEKTYNVNVKAPFFLSQECAKIMKKKKSGVIINITSINAEFAFPDNPAYQVSKAGLKQLTKSMALDLAKFGIRVNNVGPGYFRTAMTKKSWNNIKKRKSISENTIVGRWGDPKDLEGIIIFLSSDASSYITGQDIYIDGGWSVKGIK